MDNMEYINEGLFNRKKKEKREQIKFENYDKIRNAVADDLKNHLENKLKSSDVKVSLDDGTIYFKYKEYEGDSDKESDYYNKISIIIGKAIMSYNKNVISENNEDYMVIDKRIEYNNSIVDLSYKVDRFSCFILPIVEKSTIPDNYEYSQIKTLLKDINIFQIALYDNEIIIDLHTKDIDSYIKKLSNIFKDATITSQNKKIKLSERIFIKFSSNINESYIIESKELNINKINTLANIARSNGFEPSLRLRDEIISEYNEVLESSITIDESVIGEVDVSLLPIYKINEAHIILKDEEEDKKEDLTDNSEAEPVDTEVPVEPEGIEAPVESETVKENYAVDLDTIQYVSETKNISYKEAADLIMEANNIEGQMYCIIPENINEQMSLESFIELNKSIEEASMIPVCRKEYELKEFIHNVLNESGIIHVAITELSNKDWEAVGKEYKYEDRFRFKQTFGSIVDIIKNMFDNPQKSGNFESIRPRLLKMVDKCKTIEDVNYLKRDARAGNVQLTKLKQNKPEIAKGIDSHIKWIETEYMDALNNKAKEIKSKK